MRSCLQFICKGKASIPKKHMFSGDGEKMPSLRRLDFLGGSGFFQLWSAEKAGGTDTARESQRKVKGV